MPEIFIFQMHNLYTRLLRNEISGSKGKMLGGWGVLTGRECWIEEWKQLENCLKKAQRD